MTTFQLITKSALRNRFRTTLTIFGVALAILAFVFLQTVLTAWYVGAEYAAKDRVATRHKLSFVIPLPKRYIDVVRSTDGIEAATWANWTGAKDPRNPDNFFATLAVDPESFLEVYDEIALDSEARKRWFEDRRGAVVGDVLARNLGVGIGDRITLKGTIYPGDFEYNIAGIYKATRRSVDRSLFLAHWEYLNESLPERDQDKIGWTIARIDDPSRTSTISAQIDRTFEEREVPTVTMSERAMNVSFMGMLSALLAAIKVISFVILLILVMVLGNTVAMGVRERRGEFGVLRAIGFLPKHIAGMILGEATTVGLMAGLLGLLLSYPLVELGMGRWLEENMSAYFPYFRIAPETYALALVLSIVLALVAAAIPASGAHRMPVTDALRRVV